MRRPEHLMRRTDIRFVALAPSIRITAFAPPKPCVGVRGDDASTISSD
jgi:hypothetical protein